MKASVWNLRLNLDIFNSIFAALLTDQDKSYFVMGLSCGMNGGSNLPSGMSEHFAEGWQIGKDMREEAVEYRERKKEIGRLGGKPTHKAKILPTGNPLGIPVGLPSGLPSGLPNPYPIYNLQSTNLQLQTESAENQSELPMVAPQRQRKRRTKDEILLSYPDTIREVANHAIGHWPDTDPDGRVIVTSFADLCANLNLIFRGHPDATVDNLKQCIDNYLQEKKYRYCAPQFFFGPGKPGGEPPHWIKQYRFISHTAERLLVTE